MKKMTTVIYLAILNSLPLTACSSKPQQAALLHEARKMIITRSERPKTHHTREGFKNLHSAAISKGPFTYLKMKYFGDEPFADHEEDAHLMPDKPSEHDRHGQANHDEVLLTWIGHSTFLIQYRGLTIMTDPILSERASPLSFAGPRRLVPLPLTYTDLPPIDYVIISHNHYDHLDLETIEKLGDSVQYLVPLKLKEWFTAQNIAEHNVIEFDWWDKGHAGDLEVTATPSQHWSARTLLDRNKSLWAAWHIRIADFSLWFAGDTGYNDRQFKEIGAHFEQIDLALIPIGAYAPRWFMKAQHVNPEEAVKIHLDVRARQSIGMHWGTFQLSAEKMDAPRTELASALQTFNLATQDFLTLAIGETFRYQPGRR
jgi:N-acyl-phosphatidylethanolamine-hydrolysing phospholipase D